MATATERFGNYDWLRGHFDGRDVFVVAAGPSLKGFDFDRLRGRAKVIINDMALFCKPEPNDIHCWLDHSVTQRLAKSMGPNFYEWPCRIVNGPGTHLRPGGKVAVVKVNKNRFSFDFEREGVFEVLNTGMFGLSLALIAGAAKVYLLGHDCGGPELNAFDTKEVKGFLPVAISHYETFAKHYSKYAKAGATNIVNLSPISTIDSLPRADVDSVL